MREPIDGPVLAVVPVDSIDEAIALANDSDYGLGASVWTADRYQGMRIARELQAGHGLAQRPPARPDASRAGRGARRPAAGSGARSAQAGLRACAQEKLITWDPPRRAGPVVGARTTRRAPRPRGPSRSSAPARESDRERAWRSGALALARLGARALGRGACRARAHVPAVVLQLRLVHARPGLCRQGVRLPAAQGNLRPELRPGDARHPLLHRLPEARRAGAAWWSAAARSAWRRSRACSPATAR